MTMRELIFGVAFKSCICFMIFHLLSKYESKSNSYMALLVQGSIVSQL